MSRPRLAALWTVGVLVSALLFYDQIRDYPSAFLGELFGDEDPDLVSGFVGAILPILILSGCAFLSTHRKRLVLWITGMLVAIILFYIGIGRAYLSAYFAPGIGFGHPVWVISYFIGAVAPILVLGTCVILTILMGRAKDADKR